MNKKFFVSFVSAAIALNAMGSVTIFADDFVDEKTATNDLTRFSQEVVWNEDNFGDLVKLSGTQFTGNGSNELKNSNGNTLKAGDKVKTADLAAVTHVTLLDFYGEIKGLEYFTNLGFFHDSDATKITNKTLDFSANTQLFNLLLTKATNLENLILPKPDRADFHGISFLTVENAPITSLDVSEQKDLELLNLKNSKLTSLDLSNLKDYSTVHATENRYLKDVDLPNGNEGNLAQMYALDLSNNALESVNLDYINFMGYSNEYEEIVSLEGNHIGALDLSKTNVNGLVNFGTQTIYISDGVSNIDLTKEFPSLQTGRVTANNFDSSTGVLTLNKAPATTSYYYSVPYMRKGTMDDLNMVVQLIPANAMNRLYNPNSGEHFYTADLNEKKTLIALGWKDEGCGWIAPGNGAGQPVFRLYNPNAGDHHYTTNANEAQTLISYGWKDEKVGWYSDGDVTVWRQYNPFATGAGAHNYTTNRVENDHLVSLGWVGEGVAWYALR